MDSFQQRKARIAQWAEGLTADQAKQLLVPLIDHAMDADFVCFQKTALAPYWEGSGEPLIEGQQVWADE